MISAKSFCKSTLGLSVSLAMKLAPKLLSSKHGYVKAAPSVRLTCNNVDAATKPGLWQDILSMLLLVTNTGWVLSYTLFLCLLGITSRPRSG